MTTEGDRVTASDGEHGMAQYDDGSEKSYDAAYRGRGSCCIELGGGRVGRVDVDFMSGPTPSGVFQEPSAELVVGKREFGSSRHERWFARS